MATESRKTFKLNNISYYTDSIPNDVVPFFQNLGIIESELQRINIQLGITKLAQEYIVKEIEKHIDEFEVVPVAKTESEQTAV